MDDEEVVVVALGGKENGGISREKRREGERPRRLEAVGGDGGTEESMYGLPLYGEYVNGERWRLLLLLLLLRIAIGDEAERSRAEPTLAPELYKKSCASSSSNSGIGRDEDPPYRDCCC